MKYLTDISETQVMVAKKIAPEPMKLFSVRFSPTERAALEKAAKADERPAAVLLRLIAKEWLKARGYLK